MVMKALLAIDSSECSKSVVKEVAARLWPPGTVVFVLNVVDLFALTYSIGYLEPFITKETDEAHALTQSVADCLASEGIETVTQVVEGYPGTSIVEQAKVWNVDFVFVGSHGHSGLGRFFMGSVAREVLRHAHCSVEIVRGIGERESLAPARKILLATDGSAYSEAAARSVAKRPWGKGTQVKIVSIIDLVIPATDPWYAAGEVMDRMREQKRRECEQAVSSAKDLLSRAGLIASASVHEGSPKWRILDEAQEWGANIIVVGSHGRRGLTRLLLGSVSEAVAMNARCSVEVIRSPTLLAGGEK
jgi:nucleotide-binding universal stress UspA family protein